jgi:hypothetical protein
LSLHDGLVPFRWGWRIEVCYGECTQDGGGDNQLEAQTSLLIIKLNQAMIDERLETLSEIWVAFAELLDRASGLGEFDADRLIKMTEVAGQVAGSDPGYNQLIEKVAEFVSQRRGEAEGAHILLKRAQQLDFDRNDPAPQPRSGRADET